MANPIYRTVQLKTWRKHSTHSDETAAVKMALRTAGIRFRSVGHGTGTAWAWLRIKLGPDASHDEVRRALAVARAATGRRGEYGGEINVLTQ